ncbi:hypothetical protein KIN20_009871 [Parelaphostrongylus tenuis]|uniref:Uncharacterized protein n=1 Tax=Parelaphostrongylus tenuis TaxID=148309 RepID=A0AAD5MPR7_PARTN|nr:hypothetical protein KIN20_009871 [Parelaphostrongylus tenuis]
MRKSNALHKNKQPNIHSRSHLQAPNFSHPPLDSIFFDETIKLDLEFFHYMMCCSRILWVLGEKASEEGGESSEDYAFLLQPADDKAIHENLAEAKKLQKPLSNNDRHSRPTADASMCFRKLTWMKCRISPGGPISQAEIST